ncbi:hypothetical protein ABE132_14340 [Peribacillus simplex]|uniref:hypothetical protein n=1 Tax=Peribacillus simplex TaxID=1478 RepID=UPI003D2B8796
MDGNSSTPCGSYTANPSFFGFTRQCDGSSVQIYQAFTECLPTLTIRLESFGTCPFSLIIVKENKVHQRVQIEPNQFFYASFDSVKEVKVQCSDSPGGTCSFSGDIQVHGCVSCCQSSDESSDKS